MVSNFRPKPLSTWSIDLSGACKSTPFNAIVMPITVPKKAEDRDRPDDHAEQAVAGVQPGGVQVGKVFQFVVERCRPSRGGGRAPTPHAAGRRSIRPAAGRADDRAAPAGRRTPRSAAASVAGPSTELLSPARWAAMSNTLTISAASPTANITVSMYSTGWWVKYAGQTACPASCREWREPGRKTRRNPGYPIRTATW